MAEAKETERRVLALAPTGKDARATAEVLGAAGIAVTLCSDMSDLCCQLDLGAGAVLLSDESLKPEGSLAVLSAALARQPRWSDLPLVLLAGGGANSPIAMRALQDLPNVLILDRPVHLPTLISGIRTALRSRQRQYEIRDHLEERRRAEQALRASWQMLETVVNHMPTAVTLLRGSDLRVQLANPAYQAIAPGKDMAGRTLEEIWPETGRDFSALCRRVLETGEAYEVEDELNLVRRRPDGPLESAYFSWSLHRVRLPGEEGWGLLNAAWETTERVRAEQSLRESEERFRTMADGLPLIVWVHDAEGNQQFVNRTFAEFFGVQLEEMTGERWRQLLHPEDGPAYAGRFAACVRQRLPFHAEARARRADGQWRWIESYARPRFNDSGKFLGFVGASADVTERKQAEQALVAAKATAEAANQAKSQFLANMSHELRTPMNAILGMIDLALPKAIHPVVRDCLQTAKGSADLLLTLLNDLLDSAKIESGKLELESAPFSLRKTLDQLARVLAVRASEKGLAFSCRVPDETPDAVVGDRIRLQQVLLNLAGNSIKFTQRGEVRIDVRVLPCEDGACLEFAVRDTGIGIPPSRLEHIFERFAQADASTTRRFGGTGLGLSISKTLIEMMGGAIRVESEEGKGSTFSFDVRLPLAREVPADLEVPAAAPAASTPLRVLLVEDNPANQKLATYLLQDRGHTVEVAGDGEEAIRLADRNRYDVILMDVQMPGIDGLEATAAIRRRENGDRRVPIIAMTAHAMKGDRERCLAAGMDGYLSKPIDAQEMIGLVERLARGAAPAEAPAPGPAGTPPQAALVVFNREEALSRCAGEPEVLDEMIQCFFDEVDKLFPEMRAALRKGDLVEVGRLGHRMKGTVVYLGAQPATEAALRVERFCKAAGGTAEEAEEALRALERECAALRESLEAHQLSGKPAG